MNDGPRPPNSTCASPSADLTLSAKAPWSGTGSNGIRPVDLPYRAEVDAIFKQIYRDERFSVMPDKNRPKLLELWGSREQRLDRLQQAAASCLP